MEKGKTYRRKGEKGSDRYFDREITDIFGGKVYYKTGWGDKTKKCSLELFKRYMVIGRYSF